MATDLRVRWQQTALCLLLLAQLSDAIMTCPAVTAPAPLSCNIGYGIVGSLPQGLQAARPENQSKGVDGVQTCYRVITRCDGAFRNFVGNGNALPIFASAQALSATVNALYLIVCPPTLSIDTLNGLSMVYYFSDSTLDSSAPVPGQIGNVLGTYNYAVDMHNANPLSTYRMNRIYVCDVLLFVEQALRRSGAAQGSFAACNTPNCNMILVLSSAPARPPAQSVPLAASGALLLTAATLVLWPTH